MTESIQQRRRHSTGDLRKLQVHPDRGKETSDRRSSLKNTIQQLVVQIPVDNLRRIHDEEGGSWDREAEHFCGITTMHGPLRAYRGKAMYKRLWQIMMMLSACLLLYQIQLIIREHMSHPIESKVSFERSDIGLRFPLVTLCNYNPITQSYLRHINSTGLFTDTVYKYLVQSNAELQAFISTSDEDELERMDAEFQRFKFYMNPNYTVNDFFEAGGYKCEDIMKICSFAGVKFPCCSKAKESITSLGKCYTIDLWDDDFMHKQISPGEYSGLQIVLDSQLNEIYKGNGTESDPVFTNSFENGFRFYVHDRKLISFLTSEGISVSPGSRVYSSIEAESFERLPADDWGECTDEWPTIYARVVSGTQFSYSRKNCRAICRAKFFHEHCQCAPFMFNPLKSYETCTPLQLYRCISNDSMAIYKRLEETCKLCPPECSAWEYHAYNSYGFNFSDGARKWLREKDGNWTDEKIIQNFVMVSVFYRELAYTKFQEVKGSDISTVLSNIGGNMGLTFGMSVITCVEICIFLYKMIWICISKSRRRYMLEKRRIDDEKERNLEATIREYAKQREESTKTAPISKLKKLSQMLREPSLKRRVADSSRNDLTSEVTSPRSPTKKGSKQTFMDNFYEEMTTGSGRAFLRARSEQPPQPDLLELKIDFANKGGEKEVVGVIGERKNSNSLSSVKSPLQFMSRSVLFDTPIPEDDKEPKTSTAKKDSLAVPGALQHKSLSIQFNEQDMADDVSNNIARKMSNLAIPSSNLQKSRSVQFDEVSSACSGASFAVRPSPQSTRSNATTNEELPVFTFDFAHDDSPQP